MECSSRTGRKIIGWLLRRPASAFSRYPQGIDCCIQPVALFNKKRQDLISDHSAGFYHAEFWAADRTPGFTACGQRRDRQIYGELFRQFLGVAAAMNRHSVGAGTKDIFRSLAAACALADEAPSRKVRHFRPAGDRHRGRHLIV